MDIKLLFNISREMFPKQGQHPPLLHVEFSTGIKTISLVNFPFTSTRERQQALFQVGASLRKRCKTDDELRQVCFIMEGWISDNFTYERASLDPCHKEVLCATSLSIDGESRTQELYMAEILRHGSTIDLSSYQRMRPGVDNLLPAFLKGFQSAAGQ